MRQFAPLVHKARMVLYMAAERGPRGWLISTPLLREPRGGQWEKRALQQARDGAHFLFTEAVGSRPLPSVHLAQGAKDGWRLHTRFFSYPET
jgi:hypothetical protein